MLEIRDFHSLRRDQHAFLFALDFDLSESNAFALRFTQNSEKPPSFRPLPPPPTFCLQCEKKALKLLLITHHDARDVRTGKGGRFW